MEDGQHLSGYHMRPSPSDEDHSELSEAAASVAAAAAAFVANGAVAEVNPPDGQALSLGLWRPWGVGLSLRLSDVFEVIFSAFLTPMFLLGKPSSHYLSLSKPTKNEARACIFCLSGFCTCNRVSVPKVNWNSWKALHESAQYHFREHVDLPKRLLIQRRVSRRRLVK